MKTNKILVNGCSYTYGIGVTEDFGAPERKDLCWAGVLGKKLDADVINLAQPGSSNARILRSTLAHLEKEQPNLVIVMWSDAARLEFFRPQDTEYDWQSMVQVTPQGVEMIKSWYHREAMQNYFAFLHSKEKAVQDHLTAMIAVKYACEALSIPCIQFQYKTNTYRSIDLIDNEYKKNKEVATIKQMLDDLNLLRETLKGEHIFGIEEKISFNDLREEAGYPDSPWSGGHPGVDAHSFMADYFYDYIRQHDLI